MINAEQFAEWKEHPVTKEIFKSVKIIQEKLKDRLASGNTIGEHAELTHGYTNRIVGEINGLDQLMDISFADEEVQEEVNEQSGY